MTKKNFIMMASMLNDHLYEAANTNNEQQYNYIANTLLPDICIFLQSLNPRFDRDRFYDAVFEGVPPIN